MSPYARIEAAYDAEPELQSFAWYVDHHLRHGFVFSTPTYFVMGRPVSKDAEADLICEPTHLFPMAQCDCWYIHAMAGDLAAVWSVLPREMPWIAWQRAHDPEKVLRIYPLARMRAMSSSYDATPH